MNKKPPRDWYKAKKIISRKDPVIKKIIKKYKKGYLYSRNDPFYSLCRTIVGQQISTKAADSIWNKFEQKCKKKIIPKNIANLKIKDLKKVGLSKQKISYIKNIANSFLDKSFRVSIIKNLKNQDAINYITRIKGLGVWSAEMFLMFTLNRLDIFPVKDIGLLRAISKNYKTKYPPSRNFLNKISKRFTGYRSVFTWYMWKSIDPTDVEY